MIKKSILLQVLIYNILVALDLYTTWLATPDLKYESNIIIRLFKPGWFWIITLAAFFTLLVSILFVIISNKLEYLIRNREKLKINKDVSLRALIFNREILPVFLITAIFYSHLFISAVVVVINYLNYIFLFRPESPLYEPGVVIVKLQTFFYPHLPIIYQTLIILSVLVVLTRRFSVLFRR